MEDQTSTSTSTSTITSICPSTSITATATILISEKGPRAPANSPNALSRNRDPDSFR